MTNPLERVPIKTALTQTLSFARVIFGRFGFRLKRLVVIVEVEHERLDGPLCTAGSWPVDGYDQAADLARQARVIFQQAHAAKNVRGGDG